MISQDTLTRLHELKVYPGDLVYIECGRMVVYGIFVETWVDECKMILFRFITDDGLEDFFHVFPACVVSSFEETL